MRCPGRPRLSRVHHLQLRGARANAVAGPGALAGAHCQPDVAGSICHAHEPAPGSCWRAADQPGQATTPRAVVRVRTVLPERQDGGSLPRRWHCMWGTHTRIVVGVIRASGLFRHKGRCGALAGSRWRLVCLQARRRSGTTSGPVRPRVVRGASHRSPRAAAPRDRGIAGPWRSDVCVRTSRPRLGWTAGAQARGHLAIPQCSPRFGGGRRQGSFRARRGIGRARSPRQHPDRVHGIRCVCW